MYIYFFKNEIIRTARSIIPATHLRKTGISVPPYVFILKGFVAPKLAIYNNTSWHAKAASFGAQLVSAQVYSRLRKILLTQPTNYADTTVRNSAYLAKVDDKTAD